MDPTCLSSSSSFKYPSPTLPFLPVPLLPPSGSLFSTHRFFPFFLSYLLLQLSQAMSFQDHEPVQFPCHPVLETMLTETEIQDLFSFINHPGSPSSGSQGSNRAVYSSEERKLRRMQSNRESARRSRCRKKTHLENLTAQVNRLRLENRDLKNRLVFTMHQHLLLSIQNDQLRSEFLALRATLSDLCGILSTMLPQ